jgi:hypothetical protein
MSSPEIDVLHFGLGPIGLAVAGLVLRDRWLRPIAAVDTDPELRGKDLGVLCGQQAIGVSVGQTISPSDGSRVAVHCTGSSLAKVAAQLLDLVASGYHVVSTCEELSYPWDENPDLATELDAAARKGGVSVLGTGVNPGFAMDYLPLVLTAATTGVRHVSVHRVQNASTRRGPLQRKVGSGMTVEEFATRRAQGGLGHAGLRESAQAIAAGLGWRLDRLAETLEPAIARRELNVAIGAVGPGQVCGIDQTVVGFVGEREVVRLRLEMALDRHDARDAITIDAAERIELTIPGGLHGDTATASIVANAIRRIVEAPPGLRTMADLPPLRALGQA